MSDALQKLSGLSRAQLQLSKVQLRTIATQVTLCAAGLLVALLAMLAVNAAIYLWLAELVDRSAAALIVAAVNAAVALVLFTIARGTTAGPEERMAVTMRDLALADLDAETKAVQQNISQVRDDVHRLRAGFGGLSGDGGALRGLMSLTPLLDLLTSTLRRKRGK